ncbi:hypothetical protein [Limnoglobus roseus]|uniref:hypothetical protein n=1 Tax=Limnoglobus roseus TaxID=2598579 RepID=UPI0011EB6CAF|nr:hypothetical protein [Limnoglobus roseus]
MPDQKSGKKFTCKKCDVRIVIPGAPPVTSFPIPAAPSRTTGDVSSPDNGRTHDQDEDEFDITSAPESRQPSHSKSKRTRSMIVLGALVTAFVIFGVILLTMSKPFQKGFLHYNGTTQDLIQVLVSQKKIVLNSKYSEPLSRQTGHPVFLISVMHAPNQVSDIALVEFEDEESAQAYERLAKIELSNQIRQSFGFQIYDDVERFKVVNKLKSEQDVIDKMSQNKRFRYSRWIFSDPNVAGLQESFAVSAIRRAIM